MNAFDTHCEKVATLSSYAIDMSRKKGKAEASFRKERIGPGMPVPAPGVELEPAISLMRWSTQLRVP